MGRLKQGRHGRLERFHRKFVSAQAASERTRRRASFGSPFANDTVVEENGSAPRDPGELSATRRERETTLFVRPFWNHALSKIEFGTRCALKELKRFVALSAGPDAEARPPRAGFVDEARHDGMSLTPSKSAELPSMGEYAAARREWSAVREEEMRARTASEKTRRAAAKTLADLAKVERELEFRMEVRDFPDDASPRRDARKSTRALALSLSLARARRNGASARAWRRRGGASARRR